VAASRVATRAEHPGPWSRHRVDEAGPLHPPSPSIDGASPRNPRPDEERPAETNPKPTPAQRNPGGSPARPVDERRRRRAPAGSAPIPVTGQRFGETIRSRVIEWRDFLLGIPQESVSKGPSFEKSGCFEGTATGSLNSVTTGYAQRWPWPRPLLRDTWSAI
jgi:hypothetical protein